MKKEKINIGYTNEKYRENNKFILVKNKNEFNHKIDYKLLLELDFVPKIIKETKTKLIWEYIEGEKLANPTSNDLKQLARILRQLHKSDLKFPKNNLRRRTRKYLDIMKEKENTIAEIEANYRHTFKLLAKMERINPCHNDLRFENIIKDQNGKLWIVDWEYATMGDKHFDIAYLMEHCNFNKTQRKIFLDEYNAQDDYWAYIPELLPKYERYVNYLTICWALAQKKLPFPLEDLRKRLQ